MLTIHYVVTSMLISESKRAACGVKHFGHASGNIYEVTCKECLEQHKQWNTNKPKSIDDFI